MFTYKWKGLQPFKYVSVHFQLCDFVQSLWWLDTELEPTENLFSPPDYFSPGSCWPDDPWVCRLLTFKLWPPVPLPSKCLKNVNLYSVIKGTKKITSFYFIPLVNMKGFVSTYGQRTPDINTSTIIPFYLKIYTTDHKIWKYIREPGSFA